MAIFGLGGFEGPRTPDQYLEGSPFDRNVFLALTLVGIAVLARRQKAVRLLRANSAILLYFSYSLASVAWSDFPDVTFKRWFKAVGDLVMVLIVLTEADPVGATKRLFTRVGFIWMPISVLFIKYFPALGRDFHPNGNGAAWQPSYTGITTSKNLLGMITLLTGVASEWCLLVAWRASQYTRKNGPVIAHVLLLSMVVWLMSMAQSATSLVCLSLGTGLVALTSMLRLGRKPWVVGLYLLGGLSASLFAMFADLGGGLLESLGRDSTLTGRTDIWRLALGMAGNPLVGTGFESFWLGARVEKTWNVYRFHLQESHNGYLELYLTLGWIGIALFGFVIAAGLRNVLASLRHNPEMGGLKCAFFLIAIVYNLSEVGFRVQNPVWILFLFAVIVVPEPAVPKRPPGLEEGHTDSSVQDEPQADLALDTWFGQETV